MADVLGVAVGYSEAQRAVGLLIEWDEDDPVSEQFASSPERAGLLGIKLVEAAVRAGWSLDIPSGAPGTSSLDS